VIYTSKEETVRDCLIKAIKSGANLRNANLRDANLRDANLRDAIGVHPSLTTPLCIMLEQEGSVRAYARNSG